MKARLLTVTLAVVVGVLGIVAVLSYVRQADERAVKGLKAETVMVATGAIPAGTSLSKAHQENLLSTEKVPVSSLNTPAVQSLTTANEAWVVSGTVAQGQVLLQNMLARPGTLTAGSYGSVLPLPQGDIEVTMEMCLGADVAGYVQPGSYIAVFDTMTTNGVLQYSCTSHQPPANAKIVTSVVVAKIEVLSVTPASSQNSGSGTGLAADPTNPASSVTSNGQVFVTLAATSQAQAEDLILVNNAGDPTLGLLTTGSIAKVDAPFIGNALRP